MIFILALLMIPIYLLYHLIARSQGVFDGKTTATCIGILLISTLAFSAALSLFTRAKRHEILGAAAAYVPECAFDLLKRLIIIQILRRACGLSRQRQITRASMILLLSTQSSDLRHLFSS